MLEIARHLAKTRRPGDADDALPLPPTVRDAILAGLAELTPLGRQVLEAAAVLAPRLEDGLLQTTAARTAAEVADALDELLARQLLQSDPAGAAEGSLRLAHALLQQVVYQELTPWRRRLLHARAGEALRVRQAADAAVLAHHFTQAAAWETAIAFWLQAAAQSRQAHAYEIALAQVNSAFELLEPSAGGGRACA